MHRHAKQTLDITYEMCPHRFFTMAPPLDTTAITVQAAARESISVIWHVADRRPAVVVCRGVRRGVYRLLAARRSHTTCSRRRFTSGLDVEQNRFARLSPGVASGPGRSSASASRLPAPNERSFLRSMLLIARRSCDINNNIPRLRVNRQGDNKT